MDSDGNTALGGSSKGSLKLGSFESYAGDESPFFCKYDPDGNLLWARTVATQYTAWPGGTCYDVALDSSGNVFVRGYLREGSADFGGTIVYPGYGGEGFMAKYSPIGELLWVKLDPFCSLAVDKHGDIYFTYNYSVGASGVGKMNGNGDLLWKKDLSLSPSSMSQSIALDEKGQPVFTGNFSGTVTLDAITLQSIGNNPDHTGFFVVKTDVDGNVLWAIAGGGLGEVDGQQVACDSAGNVFVTAMTWTSAGSFDGIRFVPIPGTYQTTVVARLSERPSLEMALSAAGVQLSWPAKATNYVLETAMSLAPGSAWAPVLTPPTTLGRQSTVPVNTSTPAQFFRLHKP
jgi:hypothetical protein